MKDKNNFRPYVPASKTAPELTVTSIVTGVLLAIIFGAANAYLGLRVGMTVSASIPAAVISMGVVRMIMRKNSILESNIVQTVGSAGESVAAGAIFTLPALFLWAAEGRMEKPSLLEITLIALIGGLLGVFFMIPLRNALIVREHNTLPYPEGHACAEVLRAGEKDGADASTVFAGMGISALFKFIIDGLKAVPGEITAVISKAYPGAIGTQIYPAVLSVGYICGPRISSYMFAGGVLSWMVLLPLLVIIGGGYSITGAETIGDLFAAGGPSAIWSTYIRYIGAGALAAGGIISLIKSLPLIITTFRSSVKSFGTGSSSNDRTSNDIGMKAVLAVILMLTLAVWLVPAIPVSVVGATIVVIFGFFFATVSSRMVGLVGSSNNPISGMAIATLLISTMILKLAGDTGASGMQASIAIGSIICIVSAIAGDTSQDLKTGFILGATPKKQQIGEMIGVISASLTIGATLYLLDSAWGFGSEELAAPQATLMKMVIEGVMDGGLPWGLVIAGAAIAVAVEILGIPVLPFAIGVYLPVQLNACIMTGGLVRLGLERIKSERKGDIIQNGVLFCSGMIAGEGLVGILLAVLAVFGVGDVLDLSGMSRLPLWAENLGSVAVLLLVILSLLKFSLWKKPKQ